MWFKNLQLFQFIETCELNADLLENALQNKAFQACGPTTPNSLGWVAPIGEEGAPLVHAQGHYLMFCLQMEERLLPTSVVNEKLAEKIAEHEEVTGRKVGKKAKDSLKDELVYSLLPQAFTRTNRWYGYIDTQKGWLVLNVSSPNKADLVLEMLRASLGSLKVQLPELTSIEMLMTDWLMSNQYPADFAISDGCVLKDEKEGGSIRCQRQDLLSDEIHGLLEAGRTVTQLGLIWRDQLSFTLNESFHVKSIKYLEVVQDQARDVYSETEAQRFDADFSIMVGVITQLLETLLSVFAKHESSGALEQLAAETQEEATT